MSKEIKGKHLDNNYGLGCKLVLGLRRTAFFLGPVLTVSLQDTQTHHNTKRVEQNRVNTDVASERATVVQPPGWLGVV